ncbi:MAG TPA: ABC transporter permease [Candidatus Saccharimonadales bacterium]|nr:ABC transporter permease [Candidatus Saccharimonadales bacterium]
MLPTIKAELRKLYSVRSTYVITGVGLLLTIFVTGYIQGFNLKGADLLNPNHYALVITGALSSVPLILGSIVALLLITHEYRYNTILYTLTNSRSRGKVLAAKIVTVTIYALLLTVVVAVLAPLASYIGISLKGSHLVAQTIPYASLLWRSLYYGWTSLLAALAIGVLIRSQVGAIVTLFVIPTVELMFTSLLKTKAVYLPFTGTSNAILTHPAASQGTMSYGRAAIIFGLYLLVAWIVAWILFLRRDAN